MFVEAFSISCILSTFLTVEGILLRNCGQETLYSVHLFIEECKVNFLF